MSKSSLGKDLATVRQSRGMSMEEVQKATRIPPYILGAIEDDSIFMLLEHSPIYLRTYMRTYAKAVHIPEQHIIKALDQVKAGAYEGSLTSFKDDESDGNKDTSTEGQKDLFVKKKAPYGRKTFSTDDSSSFDWADIGYKAQTPKSTFPAWKKIVGIVLIIIAFICIYLIYNYYSQPSQTARNIPEQTVLKPQTPSDSLKRSLIAKDTTQVTQPKETHLQANALPDTLVMTVYAAHGKLEPLRVYTDISRKQNPYWINKGDTLRFPFVNVIRFRAINQYDRLQLLFNGHSIKQFYDKFYNPKTNMVELTRAIIEKNPQWLRP